ncbi:hypothetical protein AGMMS4956_17200 [Bacteroidia bacterium]|nr:hypothetical protein AGMMS4956_17200 [Bacteroidia bacterium]
MTGFGAAAADFADKRIAVELRSLNSKQLDLNLKIPSCYREIEADIRALLQVLQRGKVEVIVSLQSPQTLAATVINEPLFGEYLSQLKAVAAKYGNDFSITAGDILPLPNVLNTQEKSLTEPEKQVVLECTQKAIGALTAFREQEGCVLIGDILQRVEIILSLLKQITPFEKERIETVKTSLLQALRGITEEFSVDKNRFEQELIYYFEKFDITEEKTRLEQHCKYFTATSKEVGAGRKLGFIAQEMGREINTLGSKSNHSQMQHIVVQMKDELEKIKEQLLNLL